MTNTAGSIRETAREIVRQASRAGMTQACRLTEYTPAEIELEFEAFAASRQLAAQQADLAAWLAGRYVMIGVHAPKRFPSQPNCVKKTAQRMTDAQMKQAFVAMAAQRRENNGSS